MDLEKHFVYRRPEPSGCPEFWPVGDEVGSSLALYLSIEMEGHRGGIDAARLASKSGVPEADILSILDGSLFPERDVLEKLVAALGVPLDFLGQEAVLGRRISQP
jgi:hypothetical protein